MVWIRSLAQELLYAAGLAKKKRKTKQQQKKQNKKQTKKKTNCCGNRDILIRFKGRTPVYLSQLSPTKTSFSSISSAARMELKSSTFHTFKISSVCFMSDCFLFSFVLLPLSHSYILCSLKKLLSKGQFVFPSFQTNHPPFPSPPTSHLIRACELCGLRVQHVHFWYCQIPNLVPYTWKAFIQNVQCKSIAIIFKPYLSRLLFQGILNWLSFVGLKVKCAKNILKKIFD